TGCLLDPLHAPNHSTHAVHCSLSFIGFGKIREDESLVAGAYCLQESMRLLLENRLRFRVRIAAIKCVARQFEIPSPQFQHAVRGLDRDENVLVLGLATVEKSPQSAAREP